MNSVHEPGSNGGSKTSPSEKTRSKNQAGCTSTQLAQLARPGVHWRRARAAQPAVPRALCAPSRAPCLPCALPAARPACRVPRAPAPRLRAQHQHAQRLPAPACAPRARPTPHACGPQRPRLRPTPARPSAHACAPRLRAPAPTPAPQLPSPCYIVTQAHPSSQYSLYCNTNLLPTKLYCNTVSSRPATSIAIQTSPLTILFWPSNLQYNFVLQLNLHYSCNTIQATQA